MPFEKGSRQDPHLFQRCSQLSASIRKCLISDLERHILLAFSSLEFGGWDREACYLSNPLTEKKIDVIISSYGIHTIKSEDWTPTPKQSKKPMGNASCQCSMLSMVPQIELHLSNSGRNQEGLNAEGFSRHLNLCTFLSVSVTHKFVLHSSKQITLLS